MKSSAVFLFLAATAHAFKVNLFGGTICTGEDLENYAVTDDTCFGFGSITGHNTASAYISYTGSMDDNYIIEFFDTEDCTGNVVAEGSNGCLSLFDVGTPNSFRRSTIPNKKRSIPTNHTILGPHETLNAVRQKAGLEWIDMPQHDEQEEPGFKILAIWPGHWARVEENVTLTDFLDTYEFDYNTPFPDLDFMVNGGDAHSSDSDISLYSPSADSDIEARDLVATCSVLYFCSLPFFAARSTARIYSTYISPIIKSTPVRFAWSAFNNGYTIYYNTNYFFAKTTNKPDVNVCSTTSGTTASEDKDVIISALLMQIKALEKENQQAYDSLGSCLLTNGRKGEPGGSVSLDGWTTSVMKTRCPTPDCS